MEPVRLAVWVGLALLLFHVVAPASSQDEAPVDLAPLEAAALSPAQAAELSINNPVSIDNPDNLADNPSFPTINYTPVEQDVSEDEGEVDIAQTRPATFFPLSCKAKCAAGTKDVTALSLDPGTVTNPASKWALLMLAAIKNNLATLTPPLVARHLGVYSGAVYNATTLFSATLAPFLSSSTVPVAFTTRATAQLAALAGAASTTITTLFNDTLSATAVSTLLTLEPFYSARLAEATAFTQGQDVALSIISARQADGFLDTSKTPTAYNPGQTSPVKTTCSALSRGVGVWQPLMVPRSSTAFRPGPNAVLPGTQYNGLTAASIRVQSFAGAHAARSSYLVASTVSSVLPGPPKAGTAAFRNAMAAVLAQSAALDDVKKTIAEFWANGPDGTTPPGQWFRIACDEVEVKAAGSLDTAVQVLLGVGLALHDAGIATWTVKVNTLAARPITGIQCLNPTTTANAWRGPYMGVGLRSLSDWQPYQPLNFVTPPFSGYISGHATFSGAAAQFLRKAFHNLDDDTIKSPASNCYRIPEGSSTIEGKVTNPSDPRYVAGYTDVRNTGIKTKGYVPASDVVLCYRTYTDMANQAADSRLYGGIHIQVDNTHGLAYGRQIGDAVWSKVKSLTRNP